MSAVNGKGHTTFGLGQSLLTRFAPRPKHSKLANTFRSVLSGVGSVLGGTGIGTAGADYNVLLQEQLEVQRELQLVTFQSNIMKTEHETKMAAVRNLRAS